jgi:hypothetical protein
MPMQRNLYPDDWDAIAFQIKSEAGWKCEYCQRPCRLPDESLPDLISRIRAEHPTWAHDLDKANRFVLTTAHLNHEPKDCRRENLKALCAPCHCRYDLKAMGQKRRLKQERNGQLPIPLEHEEP